MARWFGEVQGDLRPGGEYRTYLAADDIESTGRVEACEPPRHLRVRSRETDESYRRGRGVPPFDAIIEATLTSDGDCERLAAHLDGTNTVDVEARWAELVPPYQELAAAIER